MEVVVVEVVEVGVVVVGREWARVVGRRRRRRRGERRVDIAALEVALVLSFWCTACEIVKFHFLGFRNDLIVFSLAFVLPNGIRREHDEVSEGGGGGRRERGHTTFFF